MPNADSTNTLVSLGSGCVPPAHLGTQHQTTALWRPVKDGTESIATKAYEDAVAFCNQKFRGKDRQMWLNGKNTIQDLKDVISDATNRSSLASERSTGWKSRLIEAWRSLSASIHHYGAIMDVLAQHHPEYVSLAWGAFKFLFSVTIHYEELKCNIAETLVKIGELLKIIEGWTSLYPTASIQATASKLYRHILVFCLKATRWTKKTRGLRILLAIAKPWAVEFDQCVQAINEECRMIKWWAQLALSAEVRDLNFHWTFAASNVTGSLHSLSHPNITAKLPEAPRSSNDFESSGVPPLPVVANAILQCLTFSAPNPQESLQVGKGLRDLRRARGALPASFWSSPSLRAWTEESKSAILYAKGDFLAREGAKDFVVDMVQLAMANKIAVIWCFNVLRKKNSASISATDIVKSLIQQMLLQFPETASMPEAINYSTLKDSDTIEDWLTLFVAIVDMMPKLLIVMEVNDLLAPGIKELSTSLKDLVSREASSVVKVIVVSYYRGSTDLFSWIGKGDRTFSVALEERKGLRNRQSVSGSKNRSPGTSAAFANGVGKLKPLLIRALK